MNRTGTDASPAVLVHDKSAVISWPPISPFSDHLPVVCLGCKTGNVYGSIPPAQKCLTQETDSLGCTARLLTWPGASG